LFLDSGGDGEPVTIGPQFADALCELIEGNAAIMEQVERAISKYVEA
jgi:hypothetical protein